MTDPIERAEVLRELDECIEQAGAANEGTWWLQEARDAIAALPAVKQETEPVAGGTVADRLDAMADRSPAGSQEQSDLYAAATIWRKHLVHRAAPPSADAEDAERTALADWLLQYVEGYREDEETCDTRLRRVAALLRRSVARKQDRA